MIEIAHPVLLNREEARAHAAAHFSPQIALLEDLANYGSNLVLRAFNSSPGKIADLVVCGVFLKQVVSMTDGCEILLSAGNTHAAFLSARAAFEASIYLDYVLAADSERRATRYLVGNYRRERLWAQRVMPGTAAAAAYRKQPEAAGIDLDELYESLGEEAEIHLNEVNRILSQAELAPIDVEFDHLKGNRKLDPDWYALDGLSSLRQVALDVGRVQEYQVFYSRGSQISHTGAYQDHIMFAHGVARLKPIRHLEHIRDLVMASFTAAFSTYGAVLTHYRPDELVALRKKYLEDWRNPFLHAPEATYNFDGRSHT